MITSQLQNPRSIVSLARAMNFYPITPYCRAAVIWMLFLIFGAAVQAQPVATAAVSPPARTDVALRGSVLATLNVGGYSACQAECRRVQGCTGYNFVAPGPGPVLPGSPGGKLGGRVDPRAANCTLMSGSLTDAQNKGVVSCRMPCTAGAAISVAMPLPGATVRDPGLVKPPVIARLPVTSAASSASAPPPIKTQLLPRPVTGMLAANTPTTPAPAPAPAPTPTPAPVARTGISGYEVVFGAAVNVPPLSHTAAAAQCPAGKVALSAGYEFTAPGDAQYGLEVRGAIPEGNHVSVLFRNANVFVAAQAKAIAVCVNAIAGMRSIEVPRIGLSAGDSPQLRQLECSATERLVGGGVMGTNDVMVASNAPQRPTFDDTIYFGTTGLAGTGGSASSSTVGAAPPSQNATSVWRSRVVSSSPVALPGAVSFSARALCAPESAVDGWELVEAAPVSLGARAQTSPAIACAANKVLLAAGVVQRSDNLLDMVVNKVSPQQNTLNWAANIKNRNTIGGSGAVNAGLAAVCVRRQ